MFTWQHLHYVTIPSALTVRMSFHGFKNQLLEIHIKKPHTVDSYVLSHIRRKGTLLVTFFCPDWNKLHDCPHIRQCFAKHCVSTFQIYQQGKSNFCPGQGKMKIQLQLTVASSPFSHPLWFCCSLPACSFSTQNEDLLAATVQLFCCYSNACQT